MTPDSEMAQFLETLVDVFRRYKFAYQRESQLQEAVEHVLLTESQVAVPDSVPFLREHALSPKDRPDFWFPRQGVAVELKTAGSLTLLTRQLHRYALLPQVRGLVLVTPLRRLCALPEAMAGVPVRVAYLEQSVF